MTFLAFWLADSTYPKGTFPSRAGFFFLQHFENKLDLQVSGIVFADRFHNVLKPPMVFCLDSAIHYS